MIESKIPKKIFARQHEITADFMKEIDKHLDEILAGRADDMFEIQDVAAIMHIHPTHLSNTIKLTTGHSPCFYFENKILDKAKAMLADNKYSIGQIAQKLTYDPSNFTKFFKHFEGITPKQYREQVLSGAYAKKTEAVTI
jgi:AraC family transcriptional regulator of adaptative response / methylphosphotriester-DNA alkyltransferase methyltransferase